MPWDPLLLCGRGLQGVSPISSLASFPAKPDLVLENVQSTVGVLGFGKIGQLTLKRLLGFGISKVLYATSKIGQPLPSSKDHFKLESLCSTLNVSFNPAESLNQLAQESDFLIVCCALTEETKGIINENFLSKMKSTAYIVNTARGPVVDSEALVEAVKNGKLAGAGLDVVDGEPNIGKDHPLVLEQKIVVLPHIGSATVETRSEMSSQAARNCLAGVGIEGFEWDNEVKL
jgi:glyoxylate/hydroxypyruvate reductase